MVDFKKDIFASNLFLIDFSYFITEFPHSKI